MTTQLGVLGATSHLGQRFVQLLADHEQFQVALLSTAQPAEATGDCYADVVDWRLSAPLPESVGDREPVAPTPAAVPTDLDLYCSALPTPVARQVEPVLAESGAAVCSTATNERFAADVPLIVPEINAAHVDLLEVQRDDRSWDGALVKSPAAPTTTVAVPLSVLDAYGLAAVQVATLQGGPERRRDQRLAMSMLNNVSPDVPGAESRLTSETPKVLGTFDGAEIQRPDLEITPSSNRVPMQEGTLANVWATLDADPDPVAIEAAFRDAPTVGLPSAPADLFAVFPQSNRPQPRPDAIRNPQQLAVGPVAATHTGIQFDCLCHSGVRGGAGGSVLNAELLVKRGYV